MGLNERGVFEIFFNQIGDMAGPKNEYGNQ